MSKFGNDVFRKTGKELSCEENCACVKSEEETIMLNISATIVWSYIDSHMSVESICNTMKELYKEANTAEYIESVVDDSIELMLEKSIIEKVC